MEDFGFEELKNDKNVQLDKKSRSSSAMDQETCARVVDEVQNKVGLNSKPKAMAAIAGVCQRGGTNRSASAVTASYSIDGKEVTSKVLAEACSKHGGTARQFARGMGTVIFKYAKYLGEEGDLSRQMALSDPNLTMDQRV